VEQLAGKVASLESRVATLEDEGKIIKGEVKQVLTEIRTAVLARENPFDVDAGVRRQPANVHVIAAAPEPPPQAAPAPPPPPPSAPEPEPAPAPEPEPAPAPSPAPEPRREPVPLRPNPAYAPPSQPEPEPAGPEWSLLTIASLSAWAEEAMRRVGSLRLEILLDLCEAAGHLSPESRAALSRVTELDVPAPESPPSTNETVVILRQLDALLHEEQDDAAPSRLRRGA
jgi:hypothetical protein